MSSLSPKLPLVATGHEDSRELLEAEITPETVLGIAKGEATATALELGTRLLRLCQAAFSWLDQFERGRLVMGTDQDDLQGSLGSAGSLSRTLRGSRSSESAAGSTYGAATTGTADSTWRIC